MAVTVRDLAEAGAAAGLLDLDAVAGWERMRLPEFLEAASARGRFPRAALYRALAELRGVPYVDCDAMAPDLAAAGRLPTVLLRRGLVLPLEDGGDVVAAVADPEDRQTIAAVRRALGGRVEVALGEPGALAAAAARALAALGRAEAEVRGDTVALLDAILEEAYLRRASDVHLEPTGAGMDVRLRIDGVLSPLVHGLRPEEAQGLVTRVKVLAGLDIAEQRAPQDGGFSHRLPLAGSAPIDVRAATISTHLGERATLRLLGTTARDLTLESLGLEDADLARLREAMRRPYGLILLCGPTGCGKSTTLHAALRELSRPDVHVMTVEDPIEYRIPGVTQVQVGAKLAFAGAVRSMLRHDPDVLMVGEIRDGETADIALKAALTGHLVLSTLHTNTAPGAVTRLFDLGCEPHLVAATLVGAIAQRLVRRLCPRCAGARAPTEAERRFLGDAIAQAVPEHAGCARCLGAGYSGRIGLFETAWMTREAARRIAARESEAAVRERLSLRTLREDAVGKVLRGITTAAEAMRATLVEA